MKGASRGERVSSRAQALSAFLAVAYPVLAVASTWPLARDLGGQLPLGTLNHSTVSLHLVWTLWWTSDRLAAGLTNYWDAPIFFPAQSTFALSEPMPLLGLLAWPLFGLELPPVRIANLLLLAMLALNGGMMFVLLRRLGLGRWPAALGGACAVVLPYSHREIGVLHLVPLAGLLGSLWAGIGWIQRPTTPRALVLGCAVAATYLVCGQHALILVLAGAPAFVLLLQRPHLRPRSLLGLFAGALLAAGLVAPVTSAQLEASRLHDMERPLRVIQAGAAQPRDWWASPWPAVVPVPGGQEPRRMDRLGLYPGSVKLALALVGLVCGFKDRSRRRSTTFVASLLVGSLGLSMLPSIGSGELFANLRSLVPGLGQVRSFYRAGVLAQLAVVILAAFGLGALLQQARGAAGAGSGLTRCAQALAILLGLIAVVDLWPREQRFALAPSLEAWAPWTRWVRTNVSADEVMVYLPMPSPGRMSGFEADAKWMLLQTAHGRRMVNGYSGFMPRDIQRVVSEAAHFPRPRVHRTLERLGVRWLVARPSWLRTREHRELDPSLWRPAYQNEALDVAVYEVVGLRPDNTFAPPIVPR